MTCSYWSWIAHVDTYLASDAWKSCRSLLTKALVLAWLLSLR